jgi:hypothetical protein
MSKLVQLVYISRSNLPEMGRSDIIAPQVAQILGKSRRNNRSKGIVGALYYGNGFFYQCLEGEEPDLLALYEILKTDPRHTDLHIVSINPIAQKSFGEWEMKYVPAEKDINQMLSTFGMTKFDPYRFDERMNKQMLQLLLKGSELNLDEGGAVNQVTTAQKCSCREWKLATLALAVLLCGGLLRQLLL